MVDDARKRLKRVSDARLARIDSDVSWFTGALESLAREWESEIVGLLAELPSTQAAARVGYIAQLQKELRRQLNKLGYDDLAEEFVNRMEGAREQALDTLTTMGIKAKRMSPIDENALTALRQIHMETLIKAGQDVAAEVGRGVVLNAIAGRSRSKMITSIGETLDSKLVRYAATYADTALVSYDRTVSWKTWDTAGIGRFLYRGPSDVKTRPWCLTRVGKEFTTDEITKMDNGTRLMPVSVYGGGWNCRHVWTPVVTGGQQ